MSQARGEMLCMCAKYSTW